MSAEWVHPNGCVYDNVPEREHARMWSDLVGWHTWHPPTNEQRKSRMLFNRANRLKGKK